MSPVYTPSLRDEAWFLDLMINFFGQGDKNDLYLRSSSFALCSLPFALS
jgi:hypothetical protein